MASGGEVGGALSGSKGSEDLEDVKCQPCQDDGEIREAVGMCTDCQEYLCQSCFDIHTKPRPMRDHKLLNKRDIMQSQVKLTRKDKCTVRCPKHSDKNVKYYCTTHGKLSCSICLNLNHRACKGVLYIPDVADDLENNAEYKQADDNLSLVLTRFEKAAENAEQKLETLDSSYTEALEMIRAFRKELNDAIDKLEREILQKASDMKSTEMKEIASANEERKEAEQVFKASMEKLDAFRKQKQNCNLFTEMMKIKAKLDDFDGQLKAIERGQSDERAEIKFTPNTDTLDSHKQNVAFGKLTVTGKQEKVKDAASPVSVTSTIVKADYSHDINVKCGEDNTICWITGSVILPENRLLITDQNNKKIKAVDVKHGGVSSQLTLSSWPWDITIISNSQVAVTLPSAKKVAFVTTAGKLAVDRSLQLGGSCCGIDYRNDKLVVSFVHPHQIKILDLQGTVLQTIQPVKQGVELFKKPYYTSFGPDGTTLYVSNCGMHEVLCTQLDGTVIRSFKDNCLKGPLQIVLDRCGNVYVSARASNAILQLTPELKKIRVLLTEKDGLNQPYTVSYSESENKLYVGMRDCNSVKAYKVTLG